MTVALIDDQILGLVLRGDSPRAIRSFELVTTGYWYVRLCQAILGSIDRPGVLSRPFADLPLGMRDRAVESVLELPDEIGLVSLRTLGPDIGRLRKRHSLNILGMEALAAAMRLDAKVFISVVSPQLEAALSAENCFYQVIS